MITPALRLAANLKWLFTELSFERRFDAAAEEGFAGVELPDPYAYTAVQVRTMLHTAGLDAVLLNTPQGAAGSRTASGMACLPDLVEEFQEGVERGLEYATELGAGLLHIVGGRRPEGLSRDEAIAQYVRNIAWAADRAQGTNVRLVLEMQNRRNAPRFVLESQAMASAVAMAVGPTVGLLFDIFHTQVQEGDIIKNLDRFLPQTSHIQIGDAPQRSEPGSGELAWPFIIEHINRFGYTGWIGCEFEPTGTSAGVLTRLSQVMRYDWRA